MNPNTALVDRLIFAVIMTGAFLFLVFAISRLFSDKSPKRKRLTQARRKDIWKRDGGRCYNCCQRVQLGNAHIDHVIPLAQGGSNDDDNLGLLCQKCNLKKGRRTPQQAKMRNPHQTDRSWIAALIFVVIIGFLILHGGL